MMIGKLNFVVRVSTQQGPHGRRKASEIIVRMGGQPIARRQTLGAWDEKTAEKEFRKFPERFTAIGSMTAEMLKAIAA